MFFSGVTDQEYEFVLNSSRKRQIFQGRAHVVPCGAGPRGSTIHIFLNFLNLFTARNEKDCRFSVHDPREAFVKLYMETL